MLRFVDISRWSPLFSSKSIPDAPAICRKTRGASCFDSECPTTMKISKDRTDSVANMFGISNPIIIILLHHTIVINTVDFIPVT